MTYLFLFAVFVAYVVTTVICIEKGKTWMAVCGWLFFGPLLIIGAIRVGKPNSKWARKYEGHPWKMKLSLGRFPKEAYVIEHVAALAADAPVGGPPSVVARRPAA